MRIKILKVCMILDLTGFVGAWLLNISTYIGLDLLSICPVFVMAVMLGLFPIALTDAFVNPLPKGFNVDGLSERLKRCNTWALLTGMLNLVAFFVSMSGIHALKRFAPMGISGQLRWASVVLILLYWVSFLRAAVGIVELKSKGSDSG